MGIKVKRNGAWVEIPTSGCKTYTQDEEPTTAKAGDLWCTEEGGDSFLQKIYDITFPVGSTKVCLNSSDIPVVPEGVTATWELDTTYNGASIWVDSNATIGSSKTGTLPKIEGSWVDIGYDIAYQAQTSGCVETAFTSETYGNTAYESMTRKGSKISIDASKNSSAYSGTDDSVIPTSHIAHIYKRTA